MNLLVDTNVLIWWLSDYPRLRTDARSILADPDNLAYVSVATTWEMAIKLGLRRLALPPDLVSWLPTTLEQDGFIPLGITLEHSLRVERLPMHHRDPFDRLLIAQAQAEGLRIMTADPAFQLYNVHVIRC